MQWMEEWSWSYILKQEKALILALANHDQASFKWEVVSFIKIYTFSSYSYEIACDNLIFLGNCKTSLRDHLKES